MATFIYFVCLSVQSVHVSGFNIDTDHPIILSASGEGFGHSMELTNNESGNPQLYVGAPLSMENGETRGSIYSCGLYVDSESGNCRKLNLRDDAGPNEVRERQFLGLDLAITGSGGESELHTCAPRRQVKIEKNWGETTQSYMSMQGKCWTLPLADMTGDADGTNYIQNTKKFNDWGGYPYGTLYSALGMSVHSVGPSATGDVLYGAPGTFSWTGTVAAKRGGTLVLGEPWDEAEMRNDDYAGYAVGSGKFKANSNEQQYVLGSPRAGTLRTGEVFIVEKFFESPTGDSADKKMKLIQRLTGSQLGEYFGASLVSADLNRDGLDDLLVGSPLATFEEARKKRSANRYAKRYEEGKITIFYNDNGILLEKGFRQPKLGLGERGSRFGSAIANLGDINSDGFDDITVGAPGLDFGAGAVYIYFGKQFPFFLEKDASQIIRASDLNQNLRGFGISFSRGLDIDNNLYNDFAIGASNSNNSVVLRTHPVVEYKGTISFSPSSINIATMKDFTMSVCVGAYPMKTVDYYMSNIKSKLTVKIDKNAEFTDDPDRKETIFELYAPVGSDEECKVFTLKASSMFSSTTLSSLRMSATVEQIDSLSQSFCKECGKVRSHHLFENQIAFQTGCKSEKCISNLKVEAYMQDQERNPYIIGSSDKLTLGVIVSNIEGEPAYKPTLQVKYPKSLQLSKSVKNCEQSEAEDYGRLLCYLPGPILPSASQKLLVEFDATVLFGGIPKLEFKIEANSDSEEINNSNNMQLFVQELQTHADLEMVGNSKAKNVTFMVEGEIKESTIVQTFQVRKSHESPIKGIMVDLEVPIGVKEMKQTILLLKNIIATYTVPELGLQDCSMSTMDIPNSVEAFSLNLNCSVAGTHCAKLTCGPFPIWDNDFAATIVITGDIITENILAGIQARFFSVTSFAELRVPSLDPLLAEFDSLPNQATFTTVFDSVSVETGGVQIWQIALSVAGSLIVLLIILLCLIFNTNFFKRKAGEKQKEDAVKAEFEQVAVDNGEESALIN